MCVFQKCHDQESCSGYRGEDIFFRQVDNMGEQANVQDDHDVETVMTSQDEDLLLDALENVEAEMKEDKSNENLMSSQDDPLLLLAVENYQL